jgi:hypothetical protein
MSRNEAQTRFDLIDPALFECGWVRADIRPEETPHAVDIVYGRGRRKLAIYRSINVLKSVNTESCSD